MASQASELIDALARRRNIHLPPAWSHGLDHEPDLLDIDFPERLCESLGWPAPEEFSRKPKAQHFPLLLFSAETGWCFAEQWQSGDEIRVITSDGVGSVTYGPDVRLIHMPFAPDLAGATPERAFDVFRAAMVRRKRMLVESGIATTVINIIALGTSVFSMQVYDRVIPRGGFSTLWVLTAGMVLALLFDFLIRNARAFMVDREAAEIDAEVSEFFFARMQSIRLDSRPAGVGTMAAQMRGLDQVRSLMASATLFVLADLPFTILFMAVIAMIGGVIALIPLVFFPLAIGLAWLFSRMIRADTANSQASSNRKNGLLVEAIDASETVKANLGGWHMLAQWNRLVESVDESEQQVRRWSTIASSTFGLLQQLAYVAIVVLGAYRVSTGDLTMGGLIACTIIGGRINGPLVASLPNLLIQWGYARSSLASLDRILEMPSDHAAGHKQVRLPELRGEVKLAEVQFQHPGTRTGIAVDALALHPGEKIGIIGPVGSGKSTLLRLLAGLYAPQRGHALIDGVDLRQVREDDLRRQVCYLPQEYRVISGTLRDNLSLGVPDPRDEVLLEAATRTGLIALINTHPKGLDLPITEGGRGLSGGQRALVGLTRALLMKPRILLLDEPTSNLDQESEARALQALFDSFGKDCTIVLVTHKIQLLAAVGRLMVVANGRIAIDGPTNAVLAKLQEQATAIQAAAAASNQKDKIDV